MSVVRVLVVDDALMMRKLLSDILSEDPDLEVVGTAANGRIALDKIPLVKPDVVTLDVEMPVLDGIATLKELRKQYRAIPVIMCSSVTEAGAAHTLEALALGARDYVIKPMQKGSFAEAKADLAANLVPKVRYWGRADSTPKPAANTVTPIASAAPQVPSPRSLGMAEVVVVGVSTGGPEALQKLLQMLPRDLPAPFLVVQHMPPVFTRLLAERLNEDSPMEVVEADAGLPLQAGQVLIAPGGKHLELSGSPGDACAQITDGPPENSCKPSVDVLFRSAAGLFGSKALAVVLTGMGQDGLLGAKAIAGAGGAVLVQDKASSTVWGMPGAVVRAGIEHTEIPLSQMAEAIVNHVRR